MVGIALALKPSVFAHGVAFALGITASSATILADAETDRPVSRAAGCGASTRDGCLKDDVEDAALRTASDDEAEGGLRPDVDATPNSLAATEALLQFVVGAASVRLVAVETWSALRGCGRLESADGCEVEIFAAHAHLRARPR